MECRWRSPLAAGCAVALLCAAVAGAQAQNLVVVPVGSVPRGVAIDPTSNVALVANSGDSTLSFVDLTTEKATATIPMATPAGVAVNPGTGVAVVANLGNNSVTVVNLATRQTRGVVQVGFSPIAVAVNPVTNVAVVANSNGNSVSLVDLATLKEIAQVVGIPNATGIQSVAIDPDLNVAAVASSTSNSLFIVDLAKRSILTQIQVELSPSGVSIDPGTKTAVVTNFNSNSVSLVDLRTNTVRATVGSIAVPQAAAVSLGTLSALVTTNGNSTLEVISLATAKSVSSFTNLPAATGVAYNERTGRTVVVLQNSGAVAILRSLGLFTTALLTTVTGASFQPGPIAPSSIVSGFGPSLASQTAGATAVPLPTVLGGVSVRVGGVLAPLFFASSGQINFQVPVLSPGAYAVEVLRGTQLISSGGLVVVAASPDLFTVNQQGTGQAAALNQDNTVNGATPAKAGSVIQLFGTGGGATNPNPPAGSAASAAALTLLTPTVQIGGLSAEVQYSGASPGLVGVWQINARIPSTVTPGSAVPVVVTIGGRTSNTATIAVQ